MHAIARASTFCLVLLLASLGCGAAPRREPAVGEPDPLCVTTERGPVVGRIRAGVREFLGIPFAAPPVGALRWRPPVAAAAWTSARDATRRGPACVQPDTGGMVRDSAEDCLNLNIWVPSDGSRNRPVLVWIHGGAFVQGSGGDDLYDGARLASRTGAIVVTFNYRLGAFGFLAHPELAREAGHAGSPSSGILDQRAALEWVQHNIAAFGGDPAAVTLFGGSAGAWSVCVHLTSPRSRGLFARAIMESGACSNALYATEVEAEAQGEALAQALGCTGPSQLACLRAQPAAAISGALPTKRGMLLRPGVWWSPVVDGTELPAQPLASMRAGAFARVPLLIGANAAEGVLHTTSFDQVSAVERDDFVREVFGAAAVDVVAAKYARATPKESLTDIVGDGIAAGPRSLEGQAVTAQR